MIQPTERNTMNIGHASGKSGLPAKTIRYYEEIGLVSPDRGLNGYRDYSDSHVHILRFVQKARALGFSIEECRELLGLYEDKSRASADVKALGSAKLAEIDGKIRELGELRATLETLVRHCHGDERPACPIIENLAEQGIPQERPARRRSAA
jgi:MerR family transcriptional regulator, copper efflux regulator